MFEIWGNMNNLSQNEQLRFKRYLTNIDEGNTLPFVPVSYPLWEEFLKNCDVAVLTFKYFCYENSPKVTINQLENALKDFKTFKDKLLISLSPIGYDYNLSKDIKIPITASRAVLKSAVKKAKIFYSEEIGSSYFTYSSPDIHLVWFEDTLSLAKKHNLIKRYGYRGIYWEDAKGLFDGNWEALYEIYQKRESK